MSENNEIMIDVISRVLNVEAETITDEISPQNMPFWDSFNGISIVSELEKEFSVHFSIEEVYVVTSVKEIREALNRHNVSFE